MNIKSNLLQMAIADGCKTIKDFAIYINKHKSQEKKKSNYVVFDSCFNSNIKVNLG